MNVANAAPNTLRRPHTNTTNNLPRPTRKRPRPPPTTTNTPILSGVVACLSGQTAPLKSHLESLLVSLGGVALRDFDPLYVTHLILDRRSGKKYEYVSRNRNKEFAKRLKIVTSGWVEACDREGRRADEEEYGLDRDEEEKERDVSCWWNGGDGGRIDRGPPKELRNASLKEACEWMTSRAFPRIFFSQQVVLVGFDDDDSRPSIRPIMSTLIRRAGGTVCWTPNDFITMVVLDEGYSEHQWEDVRSFCQHHPRGPMAVTAAWVLSSLYHCAVKPPPFPPFPCNDKALVQHPAKVEYHNDSNMASLDAIVSMKKTTVQSNLFAGNIFTIVRPKPANGTMSFERQHMESLITTHGGIFLSKQVFGAIKKDLVNASKISNASNRKFYLLSAGGYSHNPATLDPLLAELSKLGGKIIPVNPVWIKACVGDNVRYDAQEYPLLFQPQAWPVRLLPPSHHKSNPFLVSLTGFVDASRYGILWMLKELGAGYTDNLTSKNTHLICFHAVGKKYEKACEWGLHVVSVEWLYHVMRYGYTEGCEEEFSLKESDAALKSGSVAKGRVGSDGPSIETDDAAATKAHKASDGVVVSKSSVSKSQNDGNTHASYAPFPRPPDGDALIDPNAGETCNINGYSWNEICIEDIAPKTSKPPNDVNQRLLSALQSLETSNPNLFPRRSQRRRIPMINTDYNPSLPKTEEYLPDEKDEESQQTEQFTIRVDAVVGKTSDDGRDAPMSQVNDAEDNGESQVVWFAERCGR